MYESRPIAPTVAATLRKNTFVISFLYSIPFGLLLYFNSSFLIERGFSEQTVSLILAIGYVLCVCMTLVLPSWLRRFGNRWLFTHGLLLCGVLFLLVSITSNPLLLTFFLTFGIGVATSLYVLLDIFLAATSRDVSKVGRRRGILVTLRNGAYMLAQLAAVGLLAYASFARMYAAAGIAFFLLSGLAAFLLRGFRDPAYELYNWRGVWDRLAHSPDLRNTFWVEFLLRLFYSLMIVYTPLYLHENFGIPFESMGIMFAIMIVPFLLLEVPIGRLADVRWGERYVLITGFLIASVTTITLAFITTADVVVWTAALFATRIGAALLDIGSEAHFFKHIRGGDSGEVSAFRILFPLAYIVGPLLGAVLLFVLPLQYIFVALGLCMLGGVFAARALSDPR